MIISKTYQTTSQESAINGEFEESGFIYKDERMSIEDVLVQIEILGSIEWSDSQFNENTYVTTAESEYNREYYEKGIEVYYSLHFKYENDSEFEKFMQILKENNLI